MQSGHKLKKSGTIPQSLKRGAPQIRQLPRPRLLLFLTNQVQVGLLKSDQVYWGNFDLQQSEGFETRTAFSSACPCLQVPNFFGSCGLLIA